MAPDTVSQDLDAKSSLVDGHPTLTEPAIDNNDFSDIKPGNVHARGNIVAKQPQPPNDFPEGGQRAWLTVLGSSAIMFVTFGWLQALGVFQEYYQTHQLSQHTPSQIAWISSTASKSAPNDLPCVCVQSRVKRADSAVLYTVCLLSIGGPIVGKVIDDFGPALPLLLGTVFEVFGLMMASIVRCSQNVVERIQINPESFWTAAKIF
jgi:hypothetical protein